jgi:uncharacterized membrane protein
MNEVLITHLVVASLLLVVSLMMKIRPPRNINYRYGYRTPRSMKNQKSWDIANQYGANLLMWAGVSNLLVHAISYVAIGGELSIFIPLTYYIGFILVSVFMVEKRLKEPGN